MDNHPQIIYNQLPLTVRNQIDQSQVQFVVHPRLVMPVSEIFLSFFGGVIFTFLATLILFQLYSPENATDLFTQIWGTALCLIFLAVGLILIITNLVDLFRGGSYFIFTNDGLYECSGKKLTKHEWDSFIQDVTLLHALSWKTIRLKSIRSDESFFDLYLTNIPDAESIFIFLKDRIIRTKKKAELGSQTVIDDGLLNRLTVNEDIDDQTETNRTYPLLPVIFMYVICILMVLFALLFFYIFYLYVSINGLFTMFTVMMFIPLAVFLVALFVLLKLLESAKERKTTMLITNRGLYLTNNNYTKVFGWDVVSSEIRCSDTKQNSTMHIRASLEHAGKSSYARENIYLYNQSRAEELKQKMLKRIRN